MGKKGGQFPTRIGGRNLSQEEKMATTICVVGVKYLNTKQSLAKTNQKSLGSTTGAKNVCLIIGLKNKLS